MKKIILVCGLLTLAAGLRAGEQTLQVTPATLADWTVTGADKSVVSQAAALVVPANAQFARRFDNDQVVVKLKAWPVFGVASEDLPTLEVGPAALVFMREDTGGQLVLILGNAAPITLPFAVKLNSDGSSLGSLDVQLAYERTTGKVVVRGSGQTLDYAAEMSQAPVEVVVTAGTHDAMPLETLSVRLVSPDDEPDHAAADDPGATDPAAGATTAKTAKKKPSAERGFGSAGIQISSVAPDQKPAASAPSSKLEIYTPAAVRHGHVDALRTAAAQVKKP